MKTVLFTVSYLIEVEESLLSIKDEAEQFENLVYCKLSKNRRKKIDEKHTANWDGSSIIVLDTNKMNCGKCAKCGRWTTNKDLPNTIDSLCKGAIVEGQLLCDECLHISGET